MALLTEHPLLLWLLAAVYGGIFGSFFSVLIYRIPRNEPFVFSRSRCPACGRQLLPLDMIPVISFMLRKGKCRFCGNRISWEYPAVEIITMLWFGILLTWFANQHFLTIGDSLAQGCVVLYFLFFIPLAWIDIRHSILPDIFTLTGLVTGLAVSFFPGGITPFQSLLGVAAGGAPLLAIAVIGEKILKKEGAMGGGDIKMMAGLGALLGAKTILLSILFGSILGSLGGVAVLAFKKGITDHRIAFGPYLAAGTVCAFFWGDRVFAWYMNFLQ